MNIVNRMRYRGWLAPGIVLNAVAAGNVLFIPNGSRDGLLLAPNLAKSQAVQLVGKILSVCWAIPLANYAYVEDPGANEHRYPGFDRLNPFADPCVLAAPCLFDGEIVVVSGDDIAHVSFRTPRMHYSSSALSAVSDPILPAIYIPASVGAALIAGVDDTDVQILGELGRTLAYTPVRLADDSPSVAIYNSTTVAPFIGLQRHDLNLAGLYVVEHGSAHDPSHRYRTYHLKVRLREPITVDNVQVRTALISLRSQETFALDATEPFPRQLAGVFDFFTSSGTGAGTPVFSTYLVPGSRQISDKDSDLESVLTMV